MLKLGKLGGGTFSGKLRRGSAFGITPVGSGGKTVAVRGCGVNIDNLFSFNFFSIYLKTVFYLLFL
jgi:hypothetical protein